MMQQVNLYQPIFRRERKIFSAATMLQALVLFMLGLVAWYGFGEWRVQALHKDLTVMQGKAQELQKRVTALDQQIPLPTKDKALEAKYEGLLADIEAKRRGIALLAGGDFGSAGGFSSYLTALARQQVNGLWLNAISIDDGGKRLIIHGSTKKADAVPKYLQRLGKEAPFAGREFETLSMVRATGGQKGELLDYLTFDLDTVLPDEKKAQLPSEAQRLIESARSGGARQ